MMFYPGDEDTIMLEGGGTVVVTDCSDPDFWIGYMEDTPDDVGMFPSSHVEFESDVSSSSDDGGTLMGSGQCTGSSANEAGPHVSGSTDNSGADNAVLARVLYAYEADDDGNISMNVGETVVVKEQDDADWWYGHVSGHPEKLGFFPASFVEVVLEDDV
jgi:hypothetical protein